MQSTMLNERARIAGPPTSIQISRFGSKQVYVPFPSLRSCIKLHAQPQVDQNGNQISPNTLQKPDRFPYVVPVSRNPGHSQTTPRSTNVVCLQPSGNRLGIADERTQLHCLFVFILCTSQFLKLCNISGSG